MSPNLISVGASSQFEQEKDTSFAGVVASDEVFEAVATIVAHGEDIYAHVVACEEVDARADNSLIEGLDDPRPKK